MFLVKEGKTNWKYILLVVILAAIVGGGVWWYVTRPEITPTEFSEIKKPEKVNVKKYLHKDAILRGVEMPPEAEYHAISLEEAISSAIQHLENRGIKEIEICETRWILAPLGGFLIDGKGKFNIGEKNYSTFRIGVRNGTEDNAGEEFVFIARGEDDKGEIIWYPEPGPDFRPTEGEVYPEELLAYEFLLNRALFENLSSRFK